jgi:hypothetical protein
MRNKSVKRAQLLEVIAKTQEATSDVKIRIGDVGATRQVENDCIIIEDSCARVVDSVIEWCNNNGAYYRIVENRGLKITF